MRWGAHDGNRSIGHCSYLFLQIKHNAINGVCSRSVVVAVHDIGSRVWSADATIRCVSNPIETRGKVQARGE